MAENSLNTIISEFGAAAKAKLSDKGIVGAPEEQIIGPLETLFKRLSEIGGLAHGAAIFKGETAQSHIQSRPDFGVTLHNALVGFIEVKAPGKGADPRKFSDPHDKAQWQKLKSLPNLLYTDGNSFSLWRSGELEGKVVQLVGDIADAGKKLEAPATLLPLLMDFLRWHPIAPKNAKELARTSANLCRLLRNEVLELMGQGNASLLHLADVTIADPAVGTGTFLLGVLRKNAPNGANSERKGAMPNAIRGNQPEVTSQYHQKSKMLGTVYAIEA